MPSNGPNSLNFPKTASNNAKHNRFGHEYTYNATTDSWLAEEHPEYIQDPSRLAPRDTVPVVRDLGEPLQNGDMYYNTVDETTYTWDENSGYWRRTSAGAVISDTLPIDLYDGLIWQDTVNGGTFIYNQAGDTWIEAGGSGGVALDPVFFDGSWDTISNKPTGVSAFANDAGYLTSETDSQTLTLDGTDLTIANGNTVDLSSLSGGNHGVTSESVFQSQSSKTGEGFLASDWVYTNFIEAIDERGATSTGIGLGANTGFTHPDGAAIPTDTITFITKGNIRAVVSDNGKFGIGISTPAEMLHVAGNAVTTGDITAFYSDERLKNFEGKIDNALDKVTKLNGYYYTGNDIASNFGYDTENRQVGVSAQEVESILPEVVKTAAISLDGETDYKTVQYEKLVPLLIEAIKEQQAQIDELKKQHNSQ
jgi:hypothetical protein